MRLKLVGEAIFQPGRIVGTVAGKSVVLGGRSALSAIAIAEWHRIKKGTMLLRPFWEHSRKKQKDKNNKISLFLSRSFLSFPFLSTRAL